MPPSCRTALLVLFAVFIPQALPWTVGDVTFNETEHVVKNAVADGELGSARSAAIYERRQLPPENYGESPGIGKDRRIAAEQNPSKLQKENLEQEEHRGSESHDGPLDVAKQSQDLGSKDVLEMQQTTCQITTEQLVASAQATVTRVLKGLCTSQEIEARFQDFIELMTDRLNELKDVVVKLESRVDDYNEALKRGKYQQMETLVQHCDSSKQGSTALSDGDTRTKTSQDGQKTYLADHYENDASMEEDGIRQPEIHKYNSSIHIESSNVGPLRKVFTYYWRIRQMHYKLTDWNPRRSLRSQSFYIYPGGYRLYLRSYPRQNETNFFIHVGVTKGDFDQALKWPYPLKMKVAILDQSRDTRMFEDVMSRVWDPAQLCSEYNWQRPTKGDNYECVGLGFPHDLLHQRGYIYADSLVVKLTVYLDP